jgi:ABC-type proline/glycine betaine transport system substrate-binding protein
VNWAEGIAITNLAAAILKDKLGYGFTSVTSGNSDAFLWKFAQWDLKVIEDPKGILGEVENIHKYARKGFEDDMPEAAKFLKNFKLTKSQLGDLMGAIEEDGGEPLAAARAWMNSNAELVNSWLPAQAHNTNKKGPARSACCVTGPFQPHRLLFINRPFSV